MKKLFALMISMMLLSSLPVFAQETEVTPAETEAVTIRLGGLKGPTSMGMVKMLKDAQEGSSVNNYEFTMAGSADELTPALLQGQLDILAVPVNLGAVLYGKSGGAVQMLAVNTLGVIYIVENGGETIQSMEDLKGRTVYSTGKGSIPEYAFSYLLSQYGMEIDKDVTVEWKSEPTEVVAQMKAEEGSEESSVALLPQPFVIVAGTQLSDYHIAINLTEEWSKLDNGSQLVTGGLVVRKEFADENPEALASFLEEYAASTQYVNDNPAEAAQLIEEFDIVKAPVAEKAIPFCNIVCITGEEMKETLDGYFQILYDQNPAVVGGSLPAEDFYRIEE